MIGIRGQGERPKIPFLGTSTALRKATSSAFWRARRKRLQNSWGYCIFPEEEACFGASHGCLQASQITELALFQ